MLSRFIESVERNRGVYKNKEKVYNQLENIYTLGSYKTKDQATEHKLCGVTLLEQIAVDLTKDEQDILWFTVLNKDGVIKVSDIKDKLNQMLMER